MTFVGDLRPAATEYHATVAVYLVSDLHGARDALRKAVPEDAILVLLGDLINFIDYTSMTGILTEVFPLEAVEEVVMLRTEGRVRRRVRSCARVPSAARSRYVRRSGNA